MEEQAFIASGTTIRFTLANGKTLEAKPPMVADALPLLRLLGDVDRCDPKALADVVEQFATLLGVELTTFAGLTPFEVALDANRFFFQVRGGADETPAAPAGAG